MKNDPTKPITADDPRLTAYALGEGTPDERAEVEAALAVDASLIEVVESIRHTAQLLETTLAAEPLPKEPAQPKPVETASPKVIPNKRWHQRPLPRLGLAGVGIGLLVALILPTLQTARECSRHDAAVEKAVSQARSAVDDCEQTMPTPHYFKDDVDYVNGKPGRYAQIGDKREFFEFQSQFIPNEQLADENGFLDMPEGKQEVFYSQTATATQGNTFDTSFVGAPMATGQRYTTPSHPWGYAPTGRPWPTPSFQPNPDMGLAGAYNEAARTKNTVVLNRSGLDRYDTIELQKIRDTKRKLQASNVFDTNGLGVEIRPEHLHMMVTPKTIIQKREEKRIGNEVGGVKVAFKKLDDHFFDRIGVDMDIDNDDNIDREYQVFGRIVDGRGEPGYTVCKRVWEARVTDGKNQPAWDVDTPYSLCKPEWTTPLKQTEPSNTEAYDQIVENDFLRVTDSPLSTFSIDVDTAGYSNLRRFLTGGSLPPRESVRIEEMVNYFEYDYTPPKAEEKTPFAANMAVAECPWNKSHQLVRIALKGREVEEKNRPEMNLVFLLDVSGSMNSNNKLPLVKEGMTKLVHQLNKYDRVAIVVYAGASGMVLPSTAVDEEGKKKILDSLDRLNAGGSTNGGEGIRLAYNTAAQNFKTEGVNRVILCTDGDFNVGTTNQSELIELIEKKAKEDVFLTVLGFGCGNYKDSTLEKLADKGNGNYGYIDTLAEAEKLLVRQLRGTLVTIAKDVKIQVEFNPTKVAGYRLLGYENRVMAAKDFNDDTKDAGEIGAGHTVTAFYEIIPAGQEKEIETPTVDPLKYQPVPEVKAAIESLSEDGDSKKVADAPISNELLTLKLRYKEPTGDVSTKVEFPLATPEKLPTFDETDDDFRFAGSVVGFGMMLRESKYRGAVTFEKLIRWAEGAKGKDRYGYRNELIQLIRTARSISTNR